MINLRTRIAAIEVSTITFLASCSLSLAWDTYPLASQGTIWSEFVPDREGRIASGPSNLVLFAGISHQSFGGNYGDPVNALVQYGEFKEQSMIAGYPLTLDQYLYQGGMPVLLDLAASTNGAVALAYTVHEGGQIGVRCATRYGTNSLTVDQVVSSFPFTPYVDSMWLANGIVDERAAVAYVATTDGMLNWSAHQSDTNWTTELAATNAQGPIAVAVSPQGIPTISFVSDNQYRWAYRMGGIWNVETVASERVACAALAFDHVATVATVYRPESNSNILYATRGTFGGWNSEVILSNSYANHLDMDFDSDNTPAVVYSDNNNTYFAQPVGSTLWSQYVAAASSCGPGGCFYSWQYRGREPDLLYLEDGSPIILHHGYSGNYKVSSRTYYYYTSWAPVRETPWVWLYHDDADDIDDRSTEPIASMATYALQQTQVLDQDDVPIRILTSKELQNIGGQMWVHWWNGSQEHWVRGYPEHDVVLEAGSLNGLPQSGSATAVQWRCDIGSTLTEPGLNYYAVQVKVGSMLPLGEEVFDEDWLLREVTGSGQSVTNEVGQAVSEIAEFVGHDWPVTVYADQDGDTIPDVWEEAHGLSPSNPADASLDFDGDGIPNDQEHIANTSPTNGQSYFAIEDFTGGFPSLVSFFGSSNRLYTLESSVQSNGSANGLGSSWQPEPSYTRVRGLNAMQSAPYESLATGEYFRVRVQIP